VDAAQSMTTTISGFATALRADATGAAVVAVAIVGLFVLAELANRLAGSPVEWTRKGTHVGSGAIVLAFPWLFDHTVTVLVLALSFFGVLVGGRVTGLLGSIHGVKRRTGGAYYYPFAVLATWWLSGGDPLLYCVPLAVMAVADTGAALVGQQAGERVYRVMDGQRTVEGSLAFFVLSFGIVLVGCALAGRPQWPAILLTTLVVAGLTTAVESISVRGSDNLFVPYAAWLALEHTERLGLAALGEWVLGMALGVGVLLATSARAKLSAAGAVTVFLVSTLSWALGGAAWFAPLAALYGLYLAARPPEVSTDIDVVFPTTVGSMVVVLAFAHTGSPSLYAPYLVTVAANGAIAAAMVATARGWSVPLSVLVGIGLPVVVARALSPEASLLLPVAGGMIGLVLFRALSFTPLVGRRLAASLTCGLAAWALTW